MQKHGSYVYKKVNLVDRLILFEGLGFFCTAEWRAQRDSNPQPTDLESAALPLELYARDLKTK